MGSERKGREPATKKSVVLLGEVGGEGQAVTVVDEAEALEMERKREEERAAKEPEMAVMTKEPVMEKVIEEESSEESYGRRGKKAGKKKKDESIVPVMRRHGEPLMVMPDWRKLQ